MTAPSPDLQEALEYAERYRNASVLLSVGERDAVTLADEVHRLRAELAEETKQRLVLAATLESDWAEQCNAMGAVVRAAGKWQRGRHDRPVVSGAQYLQLCKALDEAVCDFRASGFLPDIELEDSQ